MLYNYKLHRVVILVLYLYALIVTLILYTNFETFVENNSEPLLLVK